MTRADDWAEKGLSWQVFDSGDDFREWGWLGWFRPEEGLLESLKEKRRQPAPCMGRRWDLNPQRLAPQASALPIELLRPGLSNNKNCNTDQYVLAKWPDLLLAASTQRFGQICHYLGLTDRLLLAGCHVFD